MTIEREAENLSIQCGVVAILIHKERVIASCSDFNNNSYGGFTLQQAQTIRVKRSLAYEMLRNLSSQLLCDAIDTYDAEKIMNNMCSRNDCKLEIILIGHGSATSAA